MCHSCSITRSRASPPPPYLPAPRGSPRLTAVGSGAGGEMGDALGGEQGFKGPASSWVSPAQQGTAGAGWDGEPKGRSLSLSGSSSARGAERGCRLEWRGLGWEEDGKRKEGWGLSDARAGEVLGQGDSVGSVKSTSPHPRRADLGVGGDGSRRRPHNRAVRGCCRLGPGIVPFPAGSPSLTVASSAEFWAPRRDQGGWCCLCARAALSPGTCWAPALDSCCGRCESAQGRRPCGCWSRPRSGRQPLQPVSAPPAAAAGLMLPPTPRPLRAPYRLRASPGRWSQTQRRSAGTTSPPPHGPPSIRDRDL